MDRLRTWKRIGNSLAAVLLLAVAGKVPPASANDLSGLPCTAEDVEILGSGVVINEPCICPAGGTFTAKVKFTVRNNSNSGRYCVTLHLIPDGVVLTTVTDVILRDVNGISTAPGKKDTEMYAEIPGFPCNLGTVCFGQAGVVQGKCDPGKCTTIGWSTSTGSAGCATPDQSPPGGQCRHQQICIVGYGATLGCKTGCTPICGGSSSLEACVVAPQSRGPFTLEVQGDDGSALQTQSTVGDASGTKCLTFTVAPTKNPNTTYVLTVRDKDNCTRTATTKIPVYPPPTVTLAAAGPLCTNASAIQLNGQPAGGTYSGPGVSASGLFNPATAGAGQHTITYSYTDGHACSNTATTKITVNARPTVTLAAAGPLCTSSIATQLNGQPAGGTYSGSGVNASGLFNPAAAGAGEHTITYSYTDGNGCSNTATTKIAVTAATATITPAAGPGCNGVATYTASVAGQTGCTYSWTVDGMALAVFLKTAGADVARIARVSGTGNNTFQFRSLDDTCHSIEVSASCTGGQALCTATASTTVKQCATTSQACTK